MPLANLDMSLDTYFTLVQRVNQLVQVTNEEQTRGFYSNGNVAVHGSVTANGNLRASEANVSGNLQVGKSVTILNDLGANVALNVASGIIKGDGREITNVQISKLSTNNFGVQSNNSTVIIGGSAELGKTLFLSVRTSTDLSDNANSNVASTQTANNLDLHIKTVHGQVNTIISTDLPSKQGVNTNLHQLANVGPFSNGDIIVFANNRMERLPIGVANQTLVVQNNRIEYANALTTTVVEKFFSSGFWNKPANFKEAIIFCVGGGGGGGSGGILGNGSGYIGPGGGGGGIGIFYANNSDLAANITVTIGAGGTGGPANVSTSLLAGGNGYIAGLTRTGLSGSGGGATSFGSFSINGGSAGGTYAGVPGIAGPNINKTNFIGYTPAPGGAASFNPNFGGSMGYGSSWGLTTANAMHPAVIVTGGGGGQTWDNTTNNAGDIGITRVYYGTYDTMAYQSDGSDQYVTNSTSGTAGILTNGSDGVAYPFHNIYISLGGCAGYSAWRSKGANGGNGIYGSGGAGGTGPSGNATNAQMNTWTSIETGRGGRGGDGYVVVISTIGRE